MYHHIGYTPSHTDGTTENNTVSPENFAQHIGYLHSTGFVSVGLSDLWAALFQGASLPPKPVVVTFDDGYDDAYRYAFPVLQNRAMTGTFFLITNFMGGAGFLNWGQAASMKQAGMEIGNHTMSHRSLAGLPYQQQVDEIDGAAKALADHLGARPKFFCYPEGHHDGHSVEVVRKTGHQAAVTISDGTLHSRSSVYTLTRVRVRASTDTKELNWLVNRQV